MAAVAHHASLMAAPSACRHCSCSATSQLKQCVHWSSIVSMSAVMNKSNCLRTLSCLVHPWRKARRGWYLASGFHFIKPSLEWVRATKTRRTPGIVTGGKVARCRGVLEGADGHTPLRVALPYGTPKQHLCNAWRARRTGRARASEAE